jgi:hypothetical protein
MNNPVCIRSIGLLLLLAASTGSSTYAQKTNAGNGTDSGTNSSQQSDETLLDETLLDETLLDGMLDDLNRVPPPPSAPSSGSASPADVPSPITDASANRQAPNRLLSSLQKQMADVTQSLMMGRVNQDVTEKQVQIVDELDMLIQQLTSTASSANSSRSKSMAAQRQQDQPSNAESVDDRVQNQNQNSAQERSAESTGGETKKSDGETRAGNLPTGTSGDANLRPVNPDELRDLSQLNVDAWGELPAQVRKQVQALQTDRFLPAYRRAIEDYYRQLAKGSK